MKCYIFRSTRQWIVSMCLQTSVFCLCVSRRFCFCFCILCILHIFLSFLCLYYCIVVPEIFAVIMTISRDFKEMKAILEMISLLNFVLRGGLIFHLTVLFCFVHLVIFFYMLLLRIIYFLFCFACLIAIFWLDMRSGWLIELFPIRLYVCISQMALPKV